MKKFFFILVLFSSPHSDAASPWLENLNTTDKQQQLDLRWKASGGEIDIQLAYQKLDLMGIHISPLPQFPNKSWESNHLVFPISQATVLELMVPYGSIEKATAGSLQANTNFSFNSSKKILNITELNFIPLEKNKDDYDIVEFKVTDQFNNHLFTTNNVHINYSADKKLLHLENMDLFATKDFATLLNMPELAQQGIGTISAFSILNIPENAKFSQLGGNCLTNPNFQDGQGVDVQLVKINAIDWKGVVFGTDKIIIAPSAELLNVGTADVPWYNKYTQDSPPYNNDQHPYLIWSVYREVDNRFEQIGTSGVKHAFFSTNIFCDCPGGHVLGVGCGDVYSSFNNDSDSALGPRNEINADSGIWDNCGTFFDPEPCTGSQQNFSSNSGQNRLSISPDEIVPNLYMHAWYLVRDDINIFNSMGYLQFNPSLTNTTWTMNPEPIANFKNGAALDNYVDPENIGENEYTQTVETGEGQFTVAVKVVALEGGLYRYNYAIENYEFDPRFISYHIPLSDSSLLIDTLFNDPDQNAENDWQFNHSDGVLTVSGDATNEQDWGMMFSFSFTTDVPPVLNNITINAAHVDELIDPNNQTVEAMSLVPVLDIIFNSSFE